MRRFTMRRLGKRLMASQIGGQVSGANRKRRAGERKKQSLKTHNITEQYSSSHEQKADILTHALQRGISSNKVFICKNCGTDLWAVVKLKFLFFSSEFLCCENCKKFLSHKDKYGYISYNEFKKVVHRET